MIPMKQKTHRTPTPYKTLSHTTTTRLPAVAPAPLAVSGQTDAQAMLNIYTSWRDEAMKRGDNITALGYDDCVGHYAAKVRAEHMDDGVSAAANVEALAL